MRLASNWNTLTLPLNTGPAELTRTRRAWPTITGLEVYSAVVTDDPSTSTFPSTAAAPPLGLYQAGRSHSLVDNLIDAANDGLVAYAKIRKQKYINDECWTVGNSPIYCPLYATVLHYYLLANLRLRDRCRGGACVGQQLYGSKCSPDCCHHRSLSCCGMQASPISLTSISHRRSTSSRLALGALPAAVAQDRVQSTKELVSSNISHTCAD